MTETPILEMRSITKRFPGVLAVDDVSMEILPGEVHALVGENGAGKSTLMKILSGVYQPDAGEIIYKGQPVSFRNPRQAQEMGITTIHQELNNIPLLTITENIFLGSEIMRGPFIHWSEMHKRSRELLAKLHMEVNPRIKLFNLGVGQQQMVEVAKALHHDSEIIIMDEPTAALSLHEIEDLFAIIRELKANGVSVIYISHHLDEAFEICDRITVLRDGQHIATHPTKEMDMEMLIRLMVGRSLDEQIPKEETERGEEVLRVEGLSNERLRDISFQANAGEVLGVAGLVGAGRTELLRAIFGADRIDQGQIYVNGNPVQIRSPQDAVNQGIALLTEDRKQQGLVLGLSTRENIALPVLEMLEALGPLISRSQERDMVNEFVQQMSIKVSSPEQLVKNLSGGNQQKVVLSKWMATKPRILLFDEPTRGIDVGAKVEIYRLMNRLARDGVALIMVSSELTEILGMSDRIMVLHNGGVAGFLNRAEATQEKIMELATGSMVAVANE